MILISDEISSHINQGFITSESINLIMEQRDCFFLKFAINSDHFTSLKIILFLS